MNNKQKERQGIYRVARIFEEAYKRHGVEIKVRNFPGSGSFSAHPHRGSWFPFDYGRDMSVGTREKLLFDSFVFEHKEINKAGVGTYWQELRDQQRERGLELYKPMLTTFYQEKPRGKKLDVAFLLADNFDTIEADYEEWKLVDEEDFKVLEREERTNLDWPGLEDCCQIVKVNEEEVIGLKLEDIAEMLAKIDSGRLNLIE